MSQQTDPKLRIVLADDHAVVREGLKLLIEAQADLAVVGQAENGQEAVRQARAHQPDVVIMDLAMPPWDGVDATVQIRRERPQVYVLALTRHAEQGYLRRMLRAGATGYLVKKTAGDQLISAIRTVAAGGLFVDPTLTREVIDRLVNDPDTIDGRHLQGEATEREAEVLRRIAWGLSNKEVAAQLGISVKTVEYHKTAAADKLRLHSRADIVRYALAQGWLDYDMRPE